MTEKSYAVLDRPEVGSILFCPRGDVVPARTVAGVHVVRIPVADEIALGGKIFQAAGGAPAPVILYFHGNGEIASDYDTIAPFYTQLGLTLFVVDYRGYGLSDGLPSATALLHDARVCFARCREVLALHKVEAGPLFVMGRSLGSAAALEIVDQNPAGVSGLILESAFAYTFALVERIGFLQIPDAFEHRDGFGNLEKMARCSVATLILHGERDWIIPISDADALYDASPAKDKRLVRIPGAGHNDLMAVGLDVYFHAIAAFCGVGPGLSDGEERAGLSE